MSQRRKNAIDFGCPRCQARLWAEPSEVGRRLRCPFCQFVLPVPTARQAAAWAAKSGVDAEYALHEGTGPTSTVPESITVTCPVCATRIAATREQMGQKVPCPDCNTPVEVRESVKSAPPKRSVRTMDPAEEYPLWGVGQPPPNVKAVYQTYIPVECSLCRTRMLATEAEVGQKLTCPDCGTATVVPPLAKPASRHGAGAPADGKETSYDVRADGGTPAPEPAAYESYFPVICPLCNTRLHASPEQVGQELVCPDCQTHIPVLAPTASPRKIDPMAGSEVPYTVGAIAERPPWQPVFTSVFAETEQVDRRGAKAGEPPAEQVMRRSLLQPPEVVPPGLWRSTVGFLFMETVWPRWLVFSGSMIVVYWLLTFAASLARVESISTWILGLGYSGLAGTAAIVWLVVFSANMMVIVVETAAGADSIEGWPDGPYQDWMPDAFYVVNALTFSAIPGVALEWLLADSHMPTGPWLAVSLFTGFPITLLSMLEWGSAIRPLSRSILASLLWSWWAWSLFYMATAALLSASVALAMLVIWGLGGWGAVPAAPILVGSLLIFFRLLGRLGMVCGGRVARWILAGVGPSRIDRCNLQLGR